MHIDFTHTQVTRARSRVVGTTGPGLQGLSPTLDNIGAVAEPIGWQAAWWQPKVKVPARAKANASMSVPQPPPRLAVEDAPAISHRSTLALEDGMDQSATDGDDDEAPLAKKPRRVASEASSPLRPRPADVASAASAPLRRRPVFASGTQKAQEPGVLVKTNNRAC